MHSPSLVYYNRSRRHIHPQLALYTHSFCGATIYGFICHGVLNFMVADVRSLKDLCTVLKNGFIQATKCSPRHFHLVSALYGWDVTSDLGECSPV